MQLLICKVANCRFANYAKRIELYFESSSMSNHNFLGEHVRQLRQGRNLKQVDLAKKLEISTAYLSQIENNDRPLTARLASKIAMLFPLDWRSDEDGASLAGKVSALREVLNDPVFCEPTNSELALTRFAEQQPELAQQFIRLYGAYRHTGERLQIVDEMMAFGSPPEQDAETLNGSRLPWEEIRDWFHWTGNYVHNIDIAAENLSHNISKDGRISTAENLIQQLSSRYAISIGDDLEGRLRDYDPEMRHLSIDRTQPSETQRFQLAHQLVSLALADEIQQVVADAGLRSPASRQLLFLGLANYAASALLMPYSKFRADARTLRHDIDRLRSLYNVSFEQACHRLSTLQRPGERGVPFFFCRVDMAGNITKRHSATRLQFARFGGACPLWIVHEAVAIPDRILVQLAEMPDGVRYVSMAKGLVKPSGSYQRLPRRYAVALGCEAQHAGEFIYADGMALHGEREGEGAATPIGVGCRICPREHCDQRAFPPSDRNLRIDPDRRSAVPYEIS